MKKVTVVLVLSILSLQVYAYPFTHKCRVPKSHTVCERHCCYNYYGPGVHCNERCVTQKFKHETSNQAC